MNVGMSVIVAIAALLGASAAEGAPRCTPDPPGVSSRAEDEAFIRKAEAEWAASVATNEAAFLRAFTAKDYVAVFDGDVLTRATLIAGAETRRPGAASNTLDE